MTGSFYMGWKPGGRDMKVAGELKKDQKQEKPELSIS